MQACHSASSSSNMLSTAMRSANFASGTWPRETGLAGWGERTRTRKCRSEKIALKHPAKPLAFRSILGREIFRGGAANDLTCGSGAKTGQFETGCPPGRGAYDND